jgi:NAD(P)-dependent dehydrogenase (short-subunit alcohol dehydrogenase family)
MAAHFGKYNIQTNAISPGGIYNQQSIDFVRNYEYKTPMQRMATVEDLLSTLLYLVSDDTAYTHGQNISVDGGFLAW